MVVLGQARLEQMEQNLSVLGVVLGFDMAFRARVTAREPINSRWRPSVCRK